MIWKFAIVRSSWMAVTYLGPRYFGDTTRISSFKNLYLPISLWKSLPEERTQISRRSSPRTASFSSGLWILYARSCCACRGTSALSLDPDTSFPKKHFLPNVCGEFLSSSFISRQKFGIQPLDMVFQFRVTHWDSLSIHIWINTFSLKVWGAFSFSLQNFNTDELLIVSC